MSKDIKVVRSAGHGSGTAGKRTPDGEREWSFNTLMSEGFAEELDKYEGVQQRLVSDISGKRDVPLGERVDIANDWGADYYFSFHHNALNGQWGTHTGTETYTYNEIVNQSSLEIAEIAQNAVVEVYKLYNRGLKRANFYELRRTKMPATLIEGGYMDSKIDIRVMRDKNKVKEAGREVARDFAAQKGLKRKSGIVTKPSIGVSGTIYRVQVGAFGRLDNAVKFAAEVENKTGFDTHLVDADKLTRVQVGAFSVKGNAENRLKQMKGKGYKDAFITTNGAQAIAEAEPYNEPEPVVVKKSIQQLVDEVKAGKHGNGETRKKSLGSDYDAVQAVINGKSKTTSSTIKVGDKVTTTKLYGSGADNSPDRTSSITGYVEKINNDWKNPYRLEKRKGKKDYLGFARKSDIRK